jgi:hypothetical protein
MNLASIDWSTFVLVGSIGLLVAGIALRMHTAAKAPTPAPERNSIGQLRPQVYH